jgi:hypothetical protein
MTFLSTGFVSQYLNYADYLEKAPVEHFEKEIETEKKVSKKKSVTDDYTHELVGQFLSNQVQRPTLTKGFYGWQSAFIDIHIPPPERIS